MKRSEALKKIKNIFEDFNHSADPKYAILAEFVLGEIEKIGMLLPPIAIYAQNGNLWNYSSKWEPEDEA